MDFIARLGALVPMPPGSPRQLVRLKHIKHASSGCITNDAARLLLSRRSKPSVNRTEVRNFSRLRRPDYSQHHLEASVDSCLMPSKYSVELGKGAFIRLILRYTIELFDIEIRVSLVFP
jgi:hypothetical protein